MDCINNIRKNLKSALKNKVSFTDTVLILFLMTGSIINAEVELKNSKDLIKEKDNKYIVNIAETDDSKISHNEFSKIKLESNEELIFNNSIRKDEKESILLNRKLDENRNLKKSEAELIIAEISKNNTNDYIKGNVEIYGSSADLLFIDEEGLEINGARFNNVRNLSFAAGKLPENKRRELKENLNGNVLKDYFESFTGTIKIGDKGIITNNNGQKSLNILAKVVELNGKIGDEKNHSEDIYIIAKEGKEEIEGEKKKVSINLNKISSIYGRNIYLEIDGKDAGIKHDNALLYANNNIEIDAKTGKIEFNINKDNVKAKNNIKLNLKDTESITINTKEDAKIEVGNKLEIKIGSGKEREDLDHQTGTVGHSFKTFIETGVKDKEDSILNLVNQINPNKLKIGKFLDFEFLTKDNTTSKKEINVLDKKIDNEIEENIKKREKETEFDQAKSNYEEDNNNENIKLSDSKYKSIKPGVKVYKIKDKENVSLIDIDEANGEGISHNYYEKLNVKNGNTLLLNNNVEYNPLTSKAIEKEIKKVNHNLKGKAARLIINELSEDSLNSTKDKEFELSGNIEVLSNNKADVIFINKNGITLNGAKFYNINNLTLSTSKLKRELEGDYLFEESKGKITLQDSGNLKDVNVLVDAKSFDIKNDLNLGNFIAYINDGYKNEHKISSDKTLKLKFKNKFENTKEISAHNLTISAKELVNSSTLKSNNLTYVYSKDKLHNTGEISSNSSITIRSDSKIENDGKISHTKKSSGYSKDKDLFIQADKIVNKKEIYAVGGLAIYADTFETEKGSKINTDKDIRINVTKTLTNNAEIKTGEELIIQTKDLINKGNLFSAKVDILASGDVKNTEKSLISAGRNDLRIKAKNILNDNSSFLSFSGFNLEAENIKNENEASIKSQSFSTGILKAKNISNKDSSIYSFGDLKIYADKLENIGSQKESSVVKKENKYERSLIVKESRIKSWFNGYNLKISVPDEKNYIDIKNSEIVSGRNLTLVNSNENQNIEVKNTNSAILAKKDLTIKGNLDNETTTVSKSAKDILQSIKLDFNWDTRSLVNKNTVFQRGNDGTNITLYEAIKQGKFNLNGGKYLSLLRNSKIYELDKVLDLTLGKDWKSKDKLEFKNENATINYYNLKNHALVSAGRNIYLEYGKVKNTDASKTSDFKGYRDEYNSESFYERVEGLENISVNTSNDNSIIKFEENIVKDNGIFKKDINNKYIYSSNDIIKSEVKDYKVFEMLNENVSNPIKNSNLKLIGDNYYQYTLITNMLFKLDKKNIAVSKEKVENILISSSKEANRLNLKLGKPLTKDELNKLKEDIIWYVEVEIDGVKVLAPTIYLSNKTVDKIKKENNETFASIEAGHNIITYRLDDITNKNSSIISNNNTLINSENISSIAHESLKSNIKAKNIKFNSNNDIEIDNTDIIAEEDIDIKAGDDVDITASNIEASGDVNILGNEINIKDRVTTTSDSLSISTSNNTGASFSEAIDKTDESTSSNIKGENIKLGSSENINIRSSNIVANEDVNINSKNVNIDSSVSNNENVLLENNYGNSKGGFTFGDEAIYINKEEKINKSNIKGSNVNITSKEKINISSSNIVAENDVNLKTDDNINIKDKTLKSSQEINTSSVQPLAINTFNKKSYDEKSSSSNVFSKGEVKLDTKKDVNIKASNIVSNDLNIKSENLNIESSNEYHKEESSSLTLGIKGNAQAGALGVGVNGNFDSSTREISGSVTNDYNARDKNKLRQLSTLSALASGEVGLGLSQKESSVEEEVHNNSKIIAGNNLNIDNNNVTDIGGADITALNNISINTGDLKTSKKKNKKVEKEFEKEINLKQSLSSTSSVLDAINTLNEIATNAENNELNEGLATLKAVGAATNLLFNDAIGGNSKQSIGINIKQKENYVSEDTKTNIKGNNISINANKGNIEFNNINLEAEGKLNLKADKDILVNGGKRENKSKNNEISIEQGISQSAGYNVVFGGNSQVGTSGNVNVSIENKNSTENILSSIKAGNVSIETGNDLTLKSAEIKSRGNVSAKVGNNLNIISEQDSIDNSKVKVGAGYNASIGAATNTIAAGSAGFNGEAGHIYEKGNEIKSQSGIEASGSIDITVENDLNLEAGVINSTTKKGSLKVKNNINISNVTTEINAGGAIVGASGGKSGELGLDVETGDQKYIKDRNNSIINIEKENIEAKNVNIDGKKSNVDEINDNINKSKEVLANKFKKGGNASLSFSVKDTKELYEKAKTKISARKNKVEESYIPKTLTQEEKDKLFNKAKLDAQNSDPSKEASKKLEEISKKAKDIPKEHLLDKLNEIAYGYDNDKVIKYVEETEKTGNKLVVPDTIDKRKLTKSDRENLGEIFKNISQSEGYNNIRKEIDKGIYDKLVDNKEFKEIINKDLAGNKENIEKLYNIVANAKKEAFKEKTNLDIEVPSLVLSDKKDKHLHGKYTDDSVSLGIYPPIKSKNKKDLNKEILNTILHELTHHDQMVLSRNKDNITDSNLKEASNIFGLNQDLYVGAHNHYDKYKNQPLEKEAFKSGDDISLDLISKTFKSEIDSKKLFEEAKKKYRERNPEKEAEKKLKLIAENSKNIPKEHLLDAVEKITYGLSPEENQALRDKSKVDGTRVVRPDTIEGFEGNNLKNTAKIFRNIEFDKSYIELREKINDTITQKLDKNPEFHRLMNTKLSGNEDGIKALFDIVESVKRETLKELVGIDGKKAEININKDRGPLSLAQGYYDKGVVNTNIVPLLSFLRTKEGNNKEILNTIIHELTHHDQAEIVKNKDKNISEDAKNDARLLALNQVFYIGSGASSYLDYKNQPLEREAFLSGDKLGEKLSKLVDKSFKENKNKKVEEPNTIKEIEHLGGKNKNLETAKDKKVGLEDNALIYGLKDGRKELIDAANKADKDANNAILADSYIGYLNLGYEFSRLSDFAKKVKENNVSDSDIDDIANFVDSAVNSNLSDSRSRINSANNDDNKRIITELLSNEKAKEALIRMDDLNQKEKALLDEIKKNPYVDIDYPKVDKSFTDEQNKVIEEYHKVKEGLNETRLDFFAEKTKLIAKETLEKGGQIYFALDGLATDSIKFDKDKTKIDFEKLKDLFEPSHPFYNSVTSRELRYIYENFKDNPNIKFTIKKQVIENPLKDLKLEDNPNIKFTIKKQVIENPLKDLKLEDNASNQSEAFERRLLPKLNIKEKVKKLFGLNKKSKEKVNNKDDDDFEDIETVRKEIKESKAQNTPIYATPNKLPKSEDNKNIDETIYSEVKVNGKAKPKVAPKPKQNTGEEPIYSDVKSIKTGEDIYENLKFTPKKLDLRVGTENSNDSIYSEIKVNGKSKPKTLPKPRLNNDLEPIYSDVKSISTGENIYENLKFTPKKLDLKKIKLSDDDNNYLKEYNERLNRLQSNSNPYERSLLPNLNLKEKLKKLFGFNKKNKEKIISVVDDDFEDIETVRKEIKESKVQNTPIYATPNKLQKSEDNKNINETIYSEVKVNGKAKPKVAPKPKQNTGEEPIYSDVKSIKTGEDIYENLKFTPKKLDLRVGTENSNDSIYSEIKVNGKSKPKTLPKPRLNNDLEPIYSDVKSISTGENIYENLKFIPQKLDLKNLEYSKDYQKKFENNK